MTRTMIAGIAVAAAALGYVAYRAYEARTTQAELRTEWQAEVAERQQLDQVVSIQFGGPVPLSKWLAEFTRQSGLAVQVDEGVRHHPYGFGLQEVSLELPVWLDLKDVPAHEGLQALADLMQVFWKEKENGIEFNVDYGDERRLQFYPRAAHLRSVDVPEFVETLDELNRNGNWDVSGVIHWTVNSPGGFTSVRTDRGQRRLEPFLTRLAAAERRFSQLSETSFPAGDSAWNPVWLHGDQAQLEKTQKALDQPISLEANGLSLRQLTSELSRRANFPIVASPAALKLHHEQNFNVDWKRVPLKHVLHELYISQVSLELFPVAGCRVLAIGTRGESSELQQFVLAYPVSDLVAADDWEESGSELSDLLTTTIEPESWQGIGGRANNRLLCRGRVLLINQRLDVHQRIQELLAAMRKVRTGAVQPAGKGITQQFALPPAWTTQIGPHSHKRLQAEVSLRCVGIERRFAISNLLDEGKITLRTNYGNQDDADARVWCYLPPQPLEANLQLFFRSCDFPRSYLNYVVADELLFTPELQAYAVFDRRPWLRKRSDQPDLIGLITQTIATDQWSDVGGPGMITAYRDQLIVRCESEILQPVGEFLAALDEHSQPGPKRWRGKVIAGDALNQPLDMKFPSPEDLRRAADLQQQNQAIEAKLQRRITKSIPKNFLGEVILDLARDQELPLIIQQPVIKPPPMNSFFGGCANSGITSNIRPRYLPDPPPKIDLSTTIGPLEVQDQPLGELLQSLISDQAGFRFEVKEGYLTVATPPPAFEPPDYFVLVYSVDDLLKPRGPLLPGQLARTLQTAIQNNDLEQEVGGQWVEVLFGNLLSKSFHDAEPRAPEIFEQLLRDLRSGKIKPLPPEPEDRNYLKPPFKPFVSSPIPVVGQRPGRIGLLPTYERQ